VWWRRCGVGREEEFDRLCPGTETDGSSPWEKLKEIKPSK